MPSSDVPPAASARRIVVTGSTGSGKSTLARRLAEQLAVPFVELDALYWEPDWVEADLQTFRERVRQATAGDGWVIAGNYSRQRDITWPRAELVVFLDLPLHLILRRLLLRSWRRWRTRELLWGTNYESFWRHLTSWRDSLLVFAVRNHRHRRSDFEQSRRDPRWAHLYFVHLRSAEDAERWLSAAWPPAGDAIG